MVRHEKFVLTAVIATVATVLGAVASNVVRNTPILAQSDQKKVILESRKTPTDQIMFSNLQFGDSARKFDEKFSAGKNWLERTSFEIENIADKDIVALSIRIRFPETKSTGPVMAYTFSLGNRPGSPGTVFQGLKPLKFERGAKMTIDLADQYPRIVDFVSKGYSMDEINHIELEAIFIVFADGTAWSVGMFMRQDKIDPTRWVPIELPGLVPTKPIEMENEQ